MDWTGPVLAVVGGFYTFAGVGAARAILMSRLLDGALEAITLQKTDRRETLREVWMLAGAALVFAGGVALLFRLEIAGPIFVASAVQQIVYLTVAAPHYFDLADAPDADGRRATTNATILYVFATAFVVWAWAAGHLVPLAQAAPLALAVFGTAVIGYSAYMIWSFMRGMCKPFRGEG